MTLDQSTPTLHSIVLVRSSSAKDLAGAYLLAAGARAAGFSSSLFPVSDLRVEECLLDTCSFLDLPARSTDFEHAVEMTGLASPDSPRTSLREVARRSENVAVISVRDEGITSVAAAVKGRPVLLCASSEHDNWPYAFALLTGRTVVESGETLAETFVAIAEARSVFLAPSPSLDTRALEVLLGVRRRHAPAVPMGFFYPFGSFERELFALKAALVARHGVPAGLRHTFLYPLERRGVSFTAAEIDFVLGARKPEEVERILRQPAAFFYTTSHSNGVNMSLGSVTLCAREDRDSATAPTSTPPCFHANICARERAGANRLAASRIQSAVAFLYTCWGVLLRDSAYDVGVSLGARVAASPFTAALISTYTTSLLDRAAGLYVARLLGEGRALGHTLLDLNRRHHARYGDNAEVAVLFGDPELTLPISGVGDEGALRRDPSFARLASETGLCPYGDGAGNQPQKSPCAVTAKEFASLEYSRCVAGATRRLARPELVEPTDRLRESIERAWLAGLELNGRIGRQGAAAVPENLGHEYDRCVRESQQAWIAFYAAMVITLGGYVRLQTDRYQLDQSTAPSSKPCPYCGGTVHLTRTELPTGRIPVRSVRECVACGTIFDGLHPIRDGTFDGPTEWTSGKPASVSIRAWSVSQHGPVAAAALLEPFVKPATSPLACASAHWPDGRANRRLSLQLPPLTPPHDLTPGVYHLNGIVMQGAGVALLRRAVTIVPAQKSTRRRP
jgi:hypothetical protein